MAEGTAAEEEVEVGSLQLEVQADDECWPLSQSPPQGALELEEAADQVLEAGCKTAATTVGVAAADEAAEAVEDCKGMS